MSDTEENEVKQVNAVALKLPTFWQAQPRVWFTQAEAQFVIRKITDQTTKFYYVVSALDQDTAGRLLDILAGPVTADSYTALKSRLVQTYGLGRRERAAKLLHMPGLGDRKPSALMDQMLSLLDGHKSCLLFETIFLEQLPEDLRMQLIGEDFADPRKLAEKADALWHAKSVNRLEIERVAAQLRTTHTRAPTSQTKTPAATSQTRTPTASGECYYHQRFGNKAYQCRPPCTFQATGNSQAGHR